MAKSEYLPEIKDEIFINRARQLSNTFLENISHSSYSGIKVQRDICKEVGKSFNVAPVVFSCNIDYSLETEKSKKIFGDIVYMSSQTPQVWLNFQIAENPEVLRSLEEAKKEIADILLISKYLLVIAFEYSG